MVHPGEGAKVSRGGFHKSIHVSDGTGRSQELQGLEAQPKCTTESQSCSSKGSKERKKQEAASNARSLQAKACKVRPSTKGTCHACWSSAQGAIPRCASCHAKHSAGPNNLGI